MITSYNEELLTILGEECAEVIQVLAKIERFGLASCYPGTDKNNIQLLHQEIADILTIIDLLKVEEFLDDHQLQNDKICKRAKLRQFMKFKPKPVTIPEY
jgi:NTP pyrophosphatase (non-canonical NTP hydrolase)